MGPLRPSGLGRVDGREGALTLPGVKTCLCARARLPGSARWAPEVVGLLLRWVSVPLPPGDSVHLHTGAPELRSSTRAVGGGIPGHGARRGLGVHSPPSAVHSAATPAWDGERSPQGPGWEGRAGRWAWLCFTPLLLVFCLQKGSGAGKPALCSGLAPVSRVALVQNLLGFQMG